MALTALVIVLVVLLVLVIFCTVAVAAAVTITVSVTVTVTVCFNVGGGGVVGRWPLAVGCWLWALAVSCWLVFVVLVLVLVLVILFPQAGQEYVLGWLPGNGWYITVRQPGGASLWSCAEGWARPFCLRCCCGCDVDQLRRFCRIPPEGLLSETSSPQGAWPAAYIPMDNPIPALFFSL